MGRKIRLAVVAGLILLGYILVSVLYRCVSPSELLIISKAIIAPSSNGNMKFMENMIVFPLPKYSALSREGWKSKTYITVGFSDEYKNKILPADGWRFVDQLGSAYLYERNGIRLTIVHNFYLSRYISEITFSVNNAQG